MAGKQIFGLKIYTLQSKLMKEITKIMIQTMKKKEKTCLKDIILKREKKKNKKKTVNEVINKCAEDFEKIVVVTKSKESIRYAKNILRNYKT